MLETGDVARDCYTGAYNAMRFVLNGLIYLMCQDVYENQKVCRFIWASGQFNNKRISRRDTLAHLKSSIVRCGIPEWWNNFSNVQKCDRDFYIFFFICISCTNANTSAISGTSAALSFNTTSENIAPIVAMYLKSRKTIDSKWLNCLVFTVHSSPMALAHQYWVH